MPTLEVPKQKVQPIVTPARQLPPGAFQAEARALQGLGEAVSGFGRELGNLSSKIALAEAQDQYDDGHLKYAQFKSDQITELSQNRNYSREMFNKNHDVIVEKIKEEATSKLALKNLTKYLDRQRIEGGIRAEVNIHRLRVAETRQKLPFVINSYAQEYADTLGITEPSDDTSDEQKEILNRLKGKFSSDIKSGAFTEAEVQDAFRRFTIMAVKEYAERYPKRAVEAVKSRASLKGLGLSEEMVALLDADDLDALQTDSQRELSYTQDKIDAQRKATIAKIKAQAASMAGEEDFAGAQRLLNSNIDLLGLQEHKLQSKNLEESSAFFGETGINYFKITHKPSVYADLRKQILTGTLKDDALIWQKVGVNGIGEPDATRLAKMIPEGGKESDFKKSAAAMLFEEMFKGSDQFIVKDQEAILARETGYRWLEDTLNNNPDWTLRQQEEEAMRVYFRVEAAAIAGEIAKRPKDLPQTPEKQIKTITTQEEYDVLPSGTRYRDANGVIGIKR